MRTFYICMLTVMLVAWSSSSLVAQEDAADFGAYLTAATNARRANFSSDIKVKIFNFGPMDQATRDEIREDANIFNHLIRMPSVTLNDSVMGVSVPQPMGQHNAMYIQGTGMVFVYHAGFPVAQTDEEAAEAEETDEPKSSWDRAREAVRTTDESVLGLVVNRQPDAPAVQYDADKIIALDQVMLNALREAGNFRNLDPGNSITVYVYGPVMLRESGATRSVMAWRVELGAGPEGKMYPQDPQKVQFVEEASSDVAQFSLYQGMSR